jgi:hypothetical protein
MKIDCVLPSGVDVKELKKYHEKCEICDSNISITKQFDSGEIFRDGKGEIFISIVRSSAATGLVRLSNSGFAIESKNVQWPITRLPKGTVLTLTQL